MLRLYVSLNEFWLKALFARIWIVSSRGTFVNNAIHHALYDIVRRQLSDLGKNINSDIRPVFTSKKIADDIRVAEAKPPLINQQCVVYEFKCDLCDADYVGYTRRHLFQRIVEHKHSAIGKHLRDSHNQENKDLTEQFTILKKCRGKFECLIYEMLFIQEKKPKLNTQSDSIKAKLFST